MAYNEYEDKQTLITNPSIPDINKVKADDMNYIKYNLPHIGTSVDSSYRTNILHSKNLFDEVWEYGGVNSTTGANENNGENTRIRTKNYIEVSASSNYVLTFDATNVGTAGARIVLYNSNKEFISTLWYNTSSGNQWAFETTSATKYIRFTAITDSGTWDLSNIHFMMNEGSEALPYEPYITPSIVVDNDEIYSKPVVLWTNSSPTSSFAGQNVIMTNWVSEYTHYEIIFQEKNDNTYGYSTGKLPITYSTRLRIPMQINLERNAVVGTNGISFGDCGYYGTYGNTTKTTNNAYIIPYQILGYK